MCCIRMLLHIVFTCWLMSTPLPTNPSVIGMHLFTKPSWISPLSICLLFHQETFNLWILCSFPSPWYELNWARNARKHFWHLTLRVRVTVKNKLKSDLTLKWLHKFKALVKSLKPTLSVGKYYMSTFKCSF